jgi:DNA polymerase-3 subunit alpha
MAQTDKLAIFADDMKRLGVDCLPPDVNASEAEFDVQPAGEGLAVRYALAALKGVGERAMELLVEERRANGPFLSLDDVARRVDPRMLNKRQLETLAGAGALDTIEENRPGVYAVAETILAVAARTHDNRTSGQGGLFGDADHGSAAIQLPQSARWTLAQRIEAEKEAFGFFFSAHPLDRYAHVAKAGGARLIATLGEVPVAEGARSGAMIAALVEDARWRTSARGKRYLMATLSDQSAQIVATCFDEGASKDLEDAAKEGGCALLTVELDRRPGEDSSRVTVRRVQPLEGIASTQRLVMTLCIDDTRALARLAELIATRRGGRAEVRVLVPTSAGGEAELLLARDFRLDGELAAAIEALPGVRELTLIEPKLAAVG